MYSLNNVERPEDVFRKHGFSCEINNMSRQMRISKHGCSRLVDLTVFNFMRDNKNIFYIMDQMQKEIEAEERNNRFTNTVPLGWHVNDLPLNKPIKPIKQENKAMPKETPNLILLLEENN